MIIMAFDTETTGLVHNRTMKLNQQPYIIEFYGCQFDLTTGEISGELDLLISPPKEAKIKLDEPIYGDKKKRSITKITNITDDMIADAPLFHEVADKIFPFLEAAPLITSHNLSFDMDMLDLEAERLARKIKWPRGICTVEQTVHMTGERLSLADLHKHLFNEEFKEGRHRAKQDVQAAIRCLIELYKRGII